MKGQTDKQTKTWTDYQNNRLMDGQREYHTNKWREKEMDRQTDEQMAEWTYMDP